MKKTFTELTTAMIATAIWSTALMLQLMLKLGEYVLKVAMKAIELTKKTENETNK